MAPTPEDGLFVGDDGLARCWWCGDDATYVDYHDREWGEPVHDDRRLFEKLALEGFQSGLSWLTILRRREGFRAAFDGFDPERVAAYDASDVTRLLDDERIIRNRAKVEATISNAQRFLELHDGGDSLDRLVWSFAPADHSAPRGRSEVPATSPESVALAGELKRRGWRFVGPTTAYAFMQSMGLVDDHLLGCHARRSPPARRGRG
jgi:DNA-3-methyladenine glycosylase I